MKKFIAFLTFIIREEKLSRENLLELLMRNSYLNSFDLQSFEQVQDKNSKRASVKISEESSNFFVETITKSSCLFLKVLWT